MKKLKKIIKEPELAHADVAESVLSKESAEEQPQIHVVSYEQLIFEELQHIRLLMEKALQK